VPALSLHPRTVGFLSISLIPAWTMSFPAWPHGSNAGSKKEVSTPNDSELEEEFHVSLPLGYNLRMFPLCVPDKCRRWQRPSRILRCFNPLQQLANGLLFRTSDSASASCIWLSVILAGPNHYALRRDDSILMTCATLRLCRIEESRKLSDTLPSAIECCDYF
jgi:hypothetical protein